MGASLRILDFVQVEGCRVCVCVVWVFFFFFFLSPLVGDRADTILSPKECAVHEKLKGRQ